MWGRWTPSRRACQAVSPGAGCVGGTGVAHATCVCMCVQLAGHLEGLPRVWWYSPAHAPNCAVTRVMNSRESMRELKVRCSGARAVGVAHVHGPISNAWGCFGPGCWRGLSGWWWRLATLRFSKSLLSFLCEWPTARSSCLKCSTIDVFICTFFVTLCHSSKDWMRSRP